MLKLANKYKLYNKHIAVYSAYFFHEIRTLRPPPVINYKTNEIHCRNYSSQPLIESVSKTQTSVFKTLSECYPVEILQTSIVQAQSVTELPWWLTIVCCTVLLRSMFTLPLSIYQHYVIAKLELLNVEMVEIVKELKQETALAVHLYKWDERTTKMHFKRSVKKQWNGLIVRENCHPMKAALLPWIQIPLWVCFSVSLRNIAYMLPVPSEQAQAALIGLTSGGFGWIGNLVVPDPTWVLPVALGIVNLAIIEIQLASRRTPSTKMQKYATNFFRGFAVAMVPLAAYVPSCMALYWVTSSSFGLAQNLLLLSPRLRRKCCIPQTSRELDKPYLSIWTGLHKKYLSRFSIT